MPRSIPFAQSGHNIVASRSGASQLPPHIDRRAPIEVPAAPERMLGYAGIEVLLLITNFRLNHSLSHSGYRLSLGIAVKIDPNRFHFGYDCKLA